MSASESPSSTLPDPPLDRDVDLTDLAYMPLHIARLKSSKSWLICKRRPELGFYMMNLWGAAWHERPAASLDDDEDVLADRAMCHPKEWPIVREDVMRGWVKCSDGRLYHPVVVEIALTSWKSKLEQRYTRNLDRLRKDNKRRKIDGEKALPLPDFEEWNQDRKNQHSTGNWALSDGKSTFSTGQLPFSDGNSPISGGRPTEFQRNTPPFPAENALKVSEVKIIKSAARRPPVVPQTFQRNSDGKSPISDGKPRFSSGQNSDSDTSQAATRDAWRDITECDAQAYEAWLQYRDEMHDPVPSATRIANAKFLAGKGSAEEQRKFVAMLVQLEFKRFRDPTPDRGNGHVRQGSLPSKPSRSIAELEDEAIARGIANGQTDAQIADETMVAVERVRAAREKLTSTSNTPNQHAEH